MLKAKKKLYGNSRSGFKIMMPVVYKDHYVVWSYSFYKTKEDAEEAFLNLPDFRVATKKDEKERLTIEQLACAV